MRGLRKCGCKSKVKGSSKNLIIHSQCYLSISLSLYLSLSLLQAPMACSILIIGWQSSLPIENAKGILGSVHMVY